MIYVATLLTTLFLWLLDTTGALARLFTAFPVLASNLGIYAIAGSLFLVVWAFVYLASRDPRIAAARLLAQVADNRGASGWLDWLVLVAVLLLAVIAFGSNSITPYLAMTLLASSAAALWSLFTGPIVPVAYSAVPLKTPVGQEQAPVSSPPAVADPANAVPRTTQVDEDIV